MRGALFDYAASLTGAFCTCTDKRVARTVAELTSYSRTPRPRLLTASGRVLLKLGFERDGLCEDKDVEVWRWRKSLMVESNTEVSMLKG